MPSAARSQAQPSSPTVTCDRERLEEIVPTGMTIALLLLEHLWMVPLLQAIERADGFELKNEWVGAEQLALAGADIAASRQSS